MTARVWSTRLIRAAYHLLPARFRENAGADLLLTCDERVAECRTTQRLLRVTIGEVASIVGLAIRLRLLRARGNHSDDNRLPLMDTLRQDIAFAMRAFARRPTFSLLIVATFGLGVGTTTAMYSVFDAVLLRPIAAPEPDRLASIYSTYPSWRTHERLSAYWDRSTFSWPGFLAFQSKQQSFSAVAAFSWSTATLTGAATPEQIGIGFAAGDFFALLGARAALGRLLVRDDPADVIVIANDFWRSRFGADTGIVGRRVMLGARSFSVVGVLPPGFEIASHWRRPDVVNAKVWRPIVPEPGDGQYSKDNSFLSVVGRLRPGVSIERASAEAARLIPAVMPTADLVVGGRVVGRVDDQSGPFRQPLLILVGAAVLLLVAACTSVATMLLGAGLDRHAELAVRAALGAERGRLVRQLLTEGILLGAAGGVFGIALSAVLLRFLLALAPANTPGLAGASLDARILGVGVLVSIGFAVLFTIVPAVVTSRVNLATAGATARLAPGGRGRLQQMLIVGELMLATVLLFGAGLLARTMQRLEHVDPGFRAEGLLTVRVAPAFSRFRDDREPAGVKARVAAYYEQLAATLRAIPGVEAVAIANILPYSSDGGSNSVEPEGVVAKPGEMLNADRRPVSANYFDVMKMPIVAGRGFSANDDRRDAAPIVVVNDALVRKFWPGTSGIGKRLGFWNQTWTVVGVVRDTREFELRGERSAKFYVPAQRLGQPEGSFVIRTSGDPSAIASAVRPALWSIDPSLPVTQIATMRERMGESIVEQRYRMRLMLAVSSLAILFAITGVYGVLSRSVVRRRRELGIRAALGAVKADVIALLLRQGLTLGVIGVCLGLVAGYFATRVLESMLYDTQRNDPVTVVGIGALVLALTFVAAWAPASRAARVQPMEVLRGD